MMKRVLMCASGVLLLSASLAAQGPAPGPVTMAQYLQRAYNGIKNNLTQAADKLSESDYGFKPSSMPEVRTFGQLFGHVANAQFGQCATAKGVPNPNMGTDHEQKTSKAEIQRALAASFAFCDDAFASLTDESGAQMVPQGRGGQMARSAVLAGMITHSNEMYGYAAVYLRAKNVVPPSSDETQRGRGAGRGGRGQ